MKKLLILNTIILCLMILLSCEKDEKRVIISDNPVAPSLLQPTDGAQFVFTAEQDTNKVLFVWKRADFGFKASVLSVLQFDLENGTFKKPKQIFVYPANSDTMLVKYKDFNTLLTGMKLPKNQQSIVLFRVQTYIANADTLYSQTIKLYVTPY